MPTVAKESFVTLATNDSYCYGALALAQSLRDAHTTRSIAILVTKGVSESMQNILRQKFDHVEVVDVMNSNDAANLGLLKRPELGITFTKLHCWRLTQYTKCVFLDADCLVLKGVDELFEREELTASTDVGWPDCFNSGVFVFKPSFETYSNLLKFALEQGSFDGGDQGLLNSYFPNWERLSFIYNMTSNVFYTYAPAFMKFKDQVKIVHFIGQSKPWHNTYNTETRQVISSGLQHESTYLNMWWAIFADSVYESLPEDIKTRIGGQLVNGKGGNKLGDVKSQLTMQNIPPQYNQPQPTGVFVGSEQHQNMWERGQIDYTGLDSFQNIQAHLDAKLKK
jgi:glycogenin glucosyltransferase